MVKIRKQEKRSTKTDASRIGIEPPLAENEQEREAAWRAFCDLAKQGWRSEGPYGPREELYDE